MLRSFAFGKYASTSLRRAGSFNRLGLGTFLTAKFCLHV